MAREIILKGVRLSFPDLFKPGEPPANSTNKTPKYGGQFIFAPDSDAMKVVRAEFERVAQEKWGANWAAIVGAIEGSKKCVRDGNKNLAKDGTIRDGYAGNFYVVARNKAKPAVVDNRFENGQPVPLTEDSGRPYGGCYVNAKIEIYPMDKAGQGRSINASLLAVQFLRHGDAFSGGPGTADGFEDEGDEGEASGGVPSGAGASAANLF